MEDVASGRNHCCGTLQRVWKFEQPIRGCSAYFQASGKASLAPCQTYLTVWLLILGVLSVLFCSVPFFSIFFFFF